MTPRSAAGASVKRYHLGLADVTNWQPLRGYRIWHDRAAFHFLTAAADQAAYLTCLKRALHPGGHAIIGTFALNGPERCSGLPVVRYDAESLGQTLGDGFALVARSGAKPCSTNRRWPSRRRTRPISRRARDTSGMEHNVQVVTIVSKLPASKGAVSADPLIRNGFLCCRLAARLSSPAEGSIP